MRSYGAERGLINTMVLAAWEVWSFIHAHGMNVCLWLYADRLRGREAHLQTVSSGVVEPDQAQLSSVKKLKTQLKSHYSEQVCKLG